MQSVNSLINRLRKIHDLTLEVDFFLCFTICDELTCRYKS